MNAETACYKAENFTKLKQRTEAALLDNLVDDLENKGDTLLGSSENQMRQRTEHPTSKKFFTSVKKVFARRRKSQSHFLDQSQATFHFDETDSGFTSVTSRSGEATGLAELRNVETILFQPTSPDFDIENVTDNSSNESTDAFIDDEDPETLAQLLKLHKDVSRLKLDKLVLLRQNVEAQREVKSRFIKEPIWIHFFLSAG